jgi:hypothetical protein
VLMARDPQEAERELTRLTSFRVKLIAAQAHLLLASLAERAAQFDVTLAHADAAAARVISTGQRTAAYDLLLPDIHAMRALALAALDRPGEARQELGLVEQRFPAFYMLERTRVRVRQVLAARASDYAAVARIAGARSPDLPISYRDDVLGEIAEVVERPSAAGRERIVRLRHEIDCDPVLGYWLEATAPGLVRRLGELRIG